MFNLELQRNINRLSGYCQTFHQELSWRPKMSIYENWTCLLNQVHLSLFVLAWCLKQVSSRFQIQICELA